MTFHDTKNKIKCNQLKFHIVYEMLIKIHALVNY